MKSTDDRSLIPVAIATDAAPEYIRAIPDAQATAGDGSVSIDLGFPPECAISTTAGGKRPEMKDINGVYNLLSGAIRSLQAYYGIYNSDFATGIGGYPAQALVQDSSGDFWVSTADNNLTVPGASGASWKSLFDGYATVDYVSSNYATVNYVSSNYATVDYVSSNYVGTSTDTSGDTNLKVYGAYYSSTAAAPYFASYDSSGNKVSYILATQDWVRGLGYTTLASVANVGYVSGVASGDNVSISNVQVVNYSGPDSSSTYMQVATPDGALAFPSAGNIYAQLISYAQPKGSYVTSDTYSSDFSTSDTRVINIASGHRIQCFTATVNGSAQTVSFPTANTSTVAVLASCSLQPGTTNRAGLVNVNSWDASSCNVTSFFLDAPDLTFATSGLPCYFIVIGEK